MDVLQVAILVLRECVISCKRFLKVMTIDIYSLRVAMKRCMPCVQVINWLFLKCCFRIKCQLNNHIAYIQIRSIAATHAIILCNRRKQILQATGWTSIHNVLEATRNDAYCKTWPTKNAYSSTWEVVRKNARIYIVYIIIRYGYSQHNLTFDWQVKPRYAY